VESITANNMAIFHEGDETCQITDTELPVNIGVKNVLIAAGINSRPAGGTEPPIPVMTDQPNMLIFPNPILGNLSSAIITAVINDNNFILLRQQRQFANTFLNGGTDISLFIICGHED